MALLQVSPLALLEACQRPTLFRVGVLADTVGFAALVVLWQVFGDGKTFLVAEEQSVAILPALHLFTGTDPELLLDLLLLVLEEHAGTERFADFIDVLREPDHQEFGDL